jgi:hypothetical protein
MNANQTGLPLMVERLRTTASQPTVKAEQLHQKLFTTPFDDTLPL